MAVDLQMLHEIHRLQGEINAATREVKGFLEQHEQRISDLPEYQALQGALAVVAETRARLKIAIQDDRELNRLHVEIGEAKFKRRDLGEILSHHLVAYTQDTGRDVVRDMESRNRRIELRARLGKPALDQPRLPLGINRQFGVHVPIPEGKTEVQRIEVSAGEGGE
jgi:hypothetical protein